MADFNQAIGLTRDPADVAQSAVDQQTVASDKALALQKEQFDYQKQLNQPFYDKGLEGFNAYSKNIMSSVDSNGNFNPEQSDAFKYREKDLGRTLRSLGRSNSSYGIGVRDRAAADEYDKQLSRLGDLTNIARGGASSLGSASGSYSTNASSSLNNSSANSANATLAGGMMEQNSLYNSQQNLGSLANLGIKAYQAYNQNNSSPSWNGSSGTIDNYNPNTTYAGDSAGPWAG